MKVPDNKKTATKLSAAEALKLIPILERILKSVMDVADVQILIEIDDPDDITQGDIDNEGVLLEADRGCANCKT